MTGILNNKYVSIVHCSDASLVASHTGAFVPPAAVVRFISWLLGIIMLISTSTLAQERFVSQAWVSDNGDGTYKNPVIHADYSDPDAIRVGNDYYMISSSFSNVPGLPILHSTDLVNWRLIGHALHRLIPFSHYAKPQHGNGVWAPSIRYHKGEFYIYFPDPDFGIYLLKSKNINGPWSEPVMVLSGKGLIDPCPLWDDNGKAYLVHALAGSRAGLKSVIMVKEMNAAGTRIINDGRIVYDGHETDPTIEGPKLYKRNGYYYIFAPAGRVSTGWQTILRSKNIYGPYERKVVLEQGSTSVNGPHQGAWVTTQKGEDWFLHFQDKEAYGRVVHLQPMKWVNNWPVIGMDADGDGKGEPVMHYSKPNVGGNYPVTSPADTDEFNSIHPGLQWQWHGNPSAHFYLTGTHLRLFSAVMPDSFKNYWDVTDMLMQKLPAEEFTATTKVMFRPKLEGETFGFVIMGLDYAYLSLVNKNDGNYLSYVTCNKADKGGDENERSLEKITGEIYLRVRVSKSASCQFSYSLDGIQYKTIDDKFTAMPGKWIGAKLGFFFSKRFRTNDSGAADIDWFRITPNQ